MVGGDDIGKWDELIAEDAGDVVGDEGAVDCVADDGVAGKECVRGVFDAGDGIDDHVGKFRGAEVAGEHCVDVRLAGESCVDDVPDGGGWERGPAPVGVFGVIREVHRVDGPYFQASALQREDGSGITHMAIGHVGLNGQNCH